MLFPRGARRPAATCCAPPAGLQHLDSRQQAASVGGQVLEELAGGCGGHVRPCGARDHPDQLIFDQLANSSLISVAACLPAHWWGKMYARSEQFLDQWLFDL